MHIREIRRLLCLTPVLMGVLGLVGNTIAQTPPITQVQKNVAKVVSVQGVPASELTPGAPAEYLVKPGDTLWGLASMFLKSPWRWPELWGMNLDSIQNPHLISPGQRLYLNKKDDAVTLSTVAPTPNSTDRLPVVRLSPQVRSEDANTGAIPTIRLGDIAPFLIDPILIDEASWAQAPRLVAFQEGRVIAAKGDRVYGVSGTGAAAANPLKVGQTLRVVRDLTPLKAPGSDDIISYEVKFVGRVKVIKGESRAAPLGAPEGSPQDAVPASLDVTLSIEEIRPGDRLMPESSFESRHYTPKAPAKKTVAQVISIHGGVVANASQNQVLVISKGSRDGLVEGDVLSFLSAGARVVDPTRSGNMTIAEIWNAAQAGEMTLDKILGVKPAIQLPNEQSGYAMVFRVFDKVAYVLVLEARGAINVGDYLVNPH